MKKFAYIAIAFVLGVFTSCTDKDDVEIIKHHTLTYIINTQNMYDDLGITAEITSNYLNNNYRVGVYTFIYDSDENLVTTQSSKESSFGAVTETFQMVEGSYTIVTYETLVGSGYTPSWSGEDKLSTLTFNDNSSSDYHYTFGAIETKVTLVGGDKTETVSPATTQALMTLNINPKSMYDEFGVTDDLTNNMLRGKKAPVGIFTYIYNSQGDLVDSIKTQQYSLNNVTLTRSLAKGDYTILTIETLVDPADNMPTYWRFDDTQKLSTVKMSQVYSNTSLYEVVGETATNINLSGNKEIAITTKAIGSLVRFWPFHFKNTSYATIYFGTTDILDYYSFNPQLSRDEKFTEKLSEPNFFTTRGFELTPEESDYYLVTIYCLESKIHYKFGVQSDAEVNSWWPWAEGDANLEDGKIYDAGFYYLYDDGENVHYSKYFGDNDGFWSWKTYWDDYINNFNTTLFEEPYTTWGGTVASVKSFMSEYQVGNEGNLIENEDNYILWYYGKNKEDEIDYYFTSATDGLTDAIVFFDAAKVGEDDLSEAFTEMEYTFVLSGDGYTAYVTKDNSSYVVLTLNSQNYWVVRYFGTSSASAPRNIVKKEFPTFAPKQPNIMSSKNHDKSSVVKSLRHCEETMKSYLNKNYYKASDVKTLLPREETMKYYSK